MGAVFFLQLEMKKRKERLIKEKMQPCSAEE